ncbi:VOC family protein [Aureibacter tunicatorum]|uniref:VOC domain-containing protein n=1 Tax=Aureibacter tunicatorum TaxID=866807 RepID=A0AAE3XRY0_9BACT|nr:VOC family protein [Aureibacter tunicatorum]MDR6240855.1 hypothetical protein [Aureibacter tunicatorum]BDD06811.1 putative glyoxylase CFP32 [Aureibacter tunicatorum]
MKKSNNPIFSDLSTYSPKSTISFYKKVFGWSFYDYHDYYSAYAGTSQVAGLYETPQKFKQMRMPHFWMTYIQVNNVDQTVNIAQSNGGIIELQEEIKEFGKIALIRDIQGAGFTIYEGDKLANARTKNTPNTLIWNELHVSELKPVLAFYASIFNWRFNQTNSYFVEVYNENNEHIADILEIPNNMKGKYEYWISTFAVKDLKSSSKKIIENGGSLIIDEGKRKLFTDNSHQAFFYISETY